MCTRYISPEAGDIERHWRVGVTNPPRRHYALVCKQNEALRANDSGDRFAISDLANFATGNPVGHSQVTAVVHRTGRSADGPYIAAVTATLAFPYVVELSDPVALDAERRWSSRNPPAKLPRQSPLEVTS